MSDKIDPRYSTDICVDFDGTIVKHEFPKIGADIPGAIYYLREFISEGARLILFTMRSDGQSAGDVLTDAVDYLTDAGIFLYGINENPGQKTWTNSPKAYGEIYIDDAAFGCPLIKPPGESPYVNWYVVGPAVLQRLRNYSDA